MSNFNIIISLPVKFPAVHVANLHHFYRLQESIDSFMEVFDYCKFTFDLSKTNKVHTIESHVLDLIEMTGEPIGSLDQCIESVHQYFSKRMESSNYKIKTKTKDSHGKKLLQLVLHFNSYNIYS